MAVQVSITWRNDNPDTIWNTLARKLGREPTNAEAATEVKRILSEAWEERTAAGQLPHPRKGR